MRVYVRNMNTHAVQDREGGGRLLDVNAVAERLGVSRQTVYRMTWRGDLPASRVGERLRYRPSDVDDYIDRNRVQTGAAP